MKSASLFGHPFISGFQKRFILTTFRLVQKTITEINTKKAKTSKVPIRKLYNLPKKGAKSL